MRLGRLTFTQDAGSSRTLIVSSSTTFPRFCTETVAVVGEPAAMAAPGEARLTEMVCAGSEP